jgi:hypothetical protein
MVGMDEGVVIEWASRGEGYRWTYGDDRDTSSVAVFIHLAFFLAVEKTVVVLHQIE